MANAISGHCLCGHITYEYVGSVGPANYCHCEDCRRHTGSAFSIGVRFDAAGFHLNGGETHSFTKQAESGNQITRHFCPRCGSPIYTSSPAHPEFIYVKAGTIDDPTIVLPTHQNWLASSVPWAHIAEGLRRYRKGSGSDAA
jgi:hypothetical protein